MERERSLPVVRLLTRRGLAVRLSLVSVLVVLSSCGGGGGGGGDALVTQPVSSGMKPATNGFAFPNFPSKTYPITFDEKDLVGMFGSGESVCVGASADPCTPTAEAAAFARMVNQARATGHCEGLVAVALSRFDAKEKPSTVALPAEGETLDAIMRAFATQFIPEAQKDADDWAVKSLKDKLAALAESFASGRLTYTLGVYVEQGGHALLPYAIEWPGENLARIKVYDSNWPGKDRWVEVDLDKKSWRFSFSGKDPLNDPKEWTGGAGDLDLTSVGARQGSCPFCGDGTKVVKNTLLLRTDNLDWSVDVNGKSVGPKTPDAAADDGVTVKPVKGAADRGAFDYVIQIPVDGGTGETEAPETSVRFTGAASMFAMTPTGIAQVETPGTSGLPVTVGQNSIESKDPAVSLTLASGNLVASATGGQSSLEVVGNTLSAVVQTSSGQTVEQQVTPDAPAARIVADSGSGSVTVLSQSAAGPVTKREVASDGSETKSTAPATSLNLSSTEYQAPKGLESKAVETLPELKNRDLTNAEYRSEVGTTAEVPAPAVKPTIGTFEVAERTYGDEPFTVQPPQSDSAGAFTFSSSNDQVATVSGSGRVTVVGAGTVFIRANQAGTDRHLPATAIATLKVSKARPTVSTPAPVSKKFGDEPFALPAVTSSNPAPFSWESTDPKVVKIGATGGKVTVVGAGTATLVATQPATEKFEATERRVLVTVSKRTTVLAPQEPIAKTYGDAEFTVAAPTGSPVTAPWNFSSSDTDVLAVNAQTGVVTVKGAGSAVVTMSQPATANDEAVTSTVTVTVAKAKPTIGSIGFATRTFGFSASSFSAAAPSSNSTGAVTWSSGDTNVATVDAATGSITVVHAGTVTITFTQAATANFEKATVSGVLTVNKGAQAQLSVTGLNGSVNVPLTPAVTGGSGSGAVTLSLVAQGTASCTISGATVTASSAGACVVVATKAGDQDHVGIATANIQLSFVALQPGIKLFEYSYYSEYLNTLNEIPDVSVQRPAAGVTSISQINSDFGYYADPFSLGEYFLIKFDGYVTSPTTGNVRFRAQGDDGLKLIIDGSTVAESWAIHCCNLVDSADIAFVAGQPRPFNLWLFQAQWGAWVSLEWSQDGGQTWQLVPTSAFSRTP